MWLRIRSVT